MILVINGSPRKDSKTMSLTNEIIKDQKDVSVFNPYHMKIESCDDCRYCNHTVGCAKKDDMDLIYDALNKTDTLILSAPIYFGAFTDKMMQLINRFQRYYGEKWELNLNSTPKIKTFISVSTAASEKDKMFNGIHVTNDMLATLFEAKQTFKLYVSESESIPVLNTTTKTQIKAIKKVI